MIGLNPLVISHKTCKPPPQATPDEYHCQWYELTDRVSYFPGIKGSVTYKSCFHDLPKGIQTHVYAPAGLEIKGKWLIEGNEAHEKREVRELGLHGVPRDGLYLREDVDMRCNILMTSFVKKTLRKSHGVLVDRLLEKADLEEDKRYRKSLLSPMMGGTMTPSMHSPVSPSTTLNSVPLLSASPSGRQVPKKQQELEDEEEQEFGRYELSSYDVLVDQTPIEGLGIGIAISSPAPYYPSNVNRRASLHTANPPPLNPRSPRRLEKRISMPQIGSPRSFSLPNFSQAQAFQKPLARTAIAELPAIETTISNDNSRVSSEAEAGAEAGSILSSQLSHSLGNSNSSSTLAVNHTEGDSNDEAGTEDETEDEDEIEARDQASPIIRRDSTMWSQSPRVPVSRNNIPSIPSLAATKGVSSTSMGADTGTQRPLTGPNGQNENERETGVVRYELE